MDEATAVLGEVNAAHGWRYRVVRRLTGGVRSGAYEIVASDRGRAVLKWSEDRAWAPQVLRAAAAVERARAGGYPTPSWLAVGTTGAGFPYQVQEFVDGTPIGAFDDRTVDLLVALNAVQAGLDPDPGRDWSAYTVEVLFDGRAGVLATARSIAPALVARIEAACAPLRGVRLPSADLVHGDFNPGNILVSRTPPGTAGVPAIAGVVDIEALGSGSRALDLAGLLILDESRPYRSRLREAVLAAAGEPGLVLGVASACLHTITWEYPRGRLDVDRVGAVLTGLDM